jgi:hypothetical protein
LFLLQTASKKHMQHKKLRPTYRSATPPTNNLMTYDVMVGQVFILISVIAHNTLCETIVKYTWFKDFP